MTASEGLGGAAYRRNQVGQPGCANGNDGSQSVERNDPYSRGRQCRDAAYGAGVFGAMIGLPAGTQIWIAAGVTAPELKVDVKSAKSYHGHDN